jgi:hypothetical protein
MVVAEPFAEGRLHLLDHLPDPVAAFPLLARAAHGVAPSGTARPGIFGTSPLAEPLDVVVRGSPPWPPAWPQRARRSLL